MEGTVKTDISDLQQHFKRTTQPAFWPAALMRRKFVAAKGGGELRRGGFAALSISIPEGGGRLRRPEPEKKDTTHVVSFFLAQRVGFEPTCDCSQTDFESFPTHAFW